jgi:hypothetical protein
MRGAVESGRPRATGRAHPAAQLRRAVESAARADRRLTDPRPWPGCSMPIHTGVRVGSAYQRPNFGCSGANFLWFREAKIEFFRRTRPISCARVGGAASALRTGECAEAAARCHFGTSCEHVPAVSARR